MPDLRFFGQSITKKIELAVKIYQSKWEIKPNRLPGVDCWLVIFCRVLAKAAARF